jgi:hypothetical protein
MKKRMYLVLALFGLLSGVAQADLTFNDEINTPNEVNNFTFTVTSTGNVNLFTISDAPFNPLLTLWTSSVTAPSAADWHFVTSNDNRVGANFFETINPSDSKINQSLTGGLYLATITESGNSALGNLLSNGFSNLGTQTGDFPYQLTIEGNVSNVAAVPLPAAIWLFGAGLMTFIGLVKRKETSRII